MLMGFYIISTYFCSLGLQRADQVRALSWGSSRN